MTDGGSEMASVLEAYGSRAELPPFDHHAVLVRPAGRVDQAHLAGRLDAYRVPLWLSAWPHGSQDPDGLAALHRELFRAPPPDPAAPARATVLRFGDIDQLVLAADRGRLDRHALLTLARAAVGTDARAAVGVDAGDVASRRPTLRGPNATAPIERASWSLSGVDRRAGRGAVRFSLPTGADESAYLAALAYTVGAYGATEPVTVAVPSAYSVLDNAAAATVGDLVKQARLRTTAGAPHVMLTLHSAPGDLAVEYFPGSQPAFPLLVHIDGAGEAVCLFDRSVHSPLMTRQFCAHFRTAVRRVLTCPPSAPASQVGPLDQSEVDGIRVLGTGAEVATDPDCLHRAVGRVAAARPDAVAVSYRADTVTYRELTVRANQYARALRALGLRHGDRIGVCLERRLDLPVVLLGALKAGCTYVPMDPGYPPDRLSYMAGDAGVAVVVATGEFPQGSAPRVIGLDELARAARAQPEDAPPDEATPDTPAYVIYTSGSTGRPKGVVVPHRNVVSLMAATTPLFGLSTEDVWTQFHSAAFDFSVWEIWGCLLTGGRLVIVPYFVARSPELFADLLAAERVSVLSQTPTAFAELTRAGRVPDGLAVRLLVFGGEPLDATRLRPWLDRYDETACRVVNMFGITETTVHVTYQVVTRRQAVEGDPSVGRPLPGWTVSVRDTAGRPVPLGVPGEIYVGGAGVAAGYLNRADLTAQRFVTDVDTGERVYRSGDLGRLRPDGNLEHLGRLDRQVKIRGHRIELDEIRAVLLDDPEVAGAAVVPGADRYGGTRLDAYLVLVGDPADQDAPRRVRARAATILPDYMLPGTWTPIPELPRTINGKLDRARLPAPRTARFGADRAALPDTGLLAAICALWNDLFGFEVGADDDFFELGGNSLLAARLAAELRARRLPAVHVRDLYRNPSPRGILRFIQTQHQGVPS
jgi:amino acid adenylation domain-containing protein